MTTTAEQSPLSTLRTRVPKEQQGQLLRSVCIEGFDELPDKLKNGKNAPALLKLLPLCVADAIADLMTIRGLGITGALELILSICLIYDHNEDNGGTPAIQVTQDTLDDQLPSPAGRGAGGEGEQ